MNYLEFRQAGIARELKERGCHRVDWTEDNFTPRIRVRSCHLGQEMGIEIPINPVLLSEAKVNDSEFVDYIIQRVESFKLKIGLTVIDAARKLTQWPLTETTKVIELDKRLGGPGHTLNLPIGWRWETDINLEKYQNDSGFSIWLGYDRDSDTLVWCPGINEL